MMPAMNIIDRMMISFQFIGTWISGSFLFRVFSFAFFAMSSIRIPVTPPDITPPIPRISAKPMKSNWVMMM